MFADFFYARNIISDLVVASAIPLRIDSKLQVDHEQTEETSKQVADFGLLAGTSRPAQR